MTDETPATETAVVVGVGPGLGKALVARFAAAGMRVAAVARNAEKLNEIIADLGPGVAPYPADASDPQAVNRTFDAVAADLGSPHLVVFNAGTFRPGRVADIDPEDFEHAWRVGCFAGFAVAQTAARHMRPAGHGTIIFTGATAALRGGAGFANLAVPKFGLRALSQSLARELGPEGIHVAHAIIDGQIESERYRHLLDERGPDSLLKPEDIAETYLAIHRQPRSAWTQEIDLRPWVETF